METKLVPDVGDSVLVQCMVREVIRNTEGVYYKVSPDMKSVWDMRVPEILVTKVPKINLEVIK